MKYNIFFYIFQKYIFSNINKQIGIRTAAVRVMHELTIRTAAVWPFKMAIRTAAVHIMYELTVRTADENQIAL
jgi:hypothetical protein